MKGLNSRKINLDQSILDGIGQEDSKQAKRPFIRRSRRSSRMEFAHLMTETDELPLS